MPLADLENYGSKSNEECHSGMKAKQNSAHE